MSETLLDYYFIEDFKRTRYVWGFESLLVEDFKEGFKDSS